eukprot:CAMPEP_0170170128 /NCGR_PEP_ID=MMETSP0040_2-20121228/3091_1 /TAXON_ID=641309 /ORGANISM="Lotharella oceanica, Strain CCMP622" /LENGTH=47 /DNA_ID= /DNA_START= /DNA_END= /DNA_ORIENTATION=
MTQTDAATRLAVADVRTNLILGGSMVPMKYIERDPNKTNRKAWATNK